jgi:hypothetical protein
MTVDLHKKVHIVQATLHGYLHLTVVVALPLGTLAVVQTRLRLIRVVLILVVEILAAAVLLVIGNNKNINNG